MEMVGYVASGEEFFETPCCIDCSVEEYCAFSNADRVLEVERVHEKKLVDVGKGIMLSEPVVVEKRLRVEGNTFFVSLSHRGILAIYSTTRDNLYDYIYEQGDGMNIIQFTDLRDEKQVEVEVEFWSSVAFYDDKMILLTWDEPLREARVEEVFNEHDISVLERIGDVDRVIPYADTSLLHSRRTLFYISTDYIPYEYNVDTRENKRINIRQELWRLSSLMGIDCGIKAVSQDANDYFTYILDWDNKVIPLHEVWEEEHLISLFASSTSPIDLSKSVLKYGNYLIQGENRMYPRKPIYFEYFHSVIRIYKDIFLLYDMNTKKWVLSRIVVG